MGIANFAKLVQFLFSLLYALPKLRRENTFPTLFVKIYFKKGQ